MKKLISGVAAAAILSVGFVGVEGTAASASPASISAPSSVSVVAVAFADYGPTKADVKDTQQKIKNLVKSGRLTEEKAKALKKDLKAYLDAGVIGLKKYRNLIRKINKNITD